MSNNIKIELTPRTDSSNNIYFVGKLFAPVLIDCREGATFLIFISEEGAEQMQIAPMDNKNKKE